MPGPSSTVSTAKSTAKSTTKSTTKPTKPNDVTAAKKPAQKQSHKSHDKSKKHKSTETKKDEKYSPPNLWKEAHDALRADPFGKARLTKLTAILKKELAASPSLKLRSQDGYKHLLTLIQTRARTLDDAPPSKTAETLHLVRSTLVNLQDVVAAGASAAGPYVAIPAAALFVAFSADAVYRAEKSAMFRLAAQLAHYMVLHRKAHLRCCPAAGDDADMRDLKARLHVLYVGLHRAMLLAAAQLTIAAYAPWVYVKNIAKHYDWAGQLEGLVEQASMCAQYRDEMESWGKLAGPERPRVERGALGPGPRNSLHWAVALGVPEQVVKFVTEETFPINALSPRGWTAVHFAAEEGSPKVMKTLLTAPGVDLMIRNDEGRTALHVAAMRNKVGAVKLLLQREPELRGVRDKGGRTAWLWAAAKGNVDVLKALKSVGQDVNETTKGGWGALHLAGESDRVDAVKYLVDVGTKKDARIKEGRRKGCTPKELAVQKGKTAVLEFL